MKNYMTITEALYDKVEDIMDDGDDSDETPQNILRKIMNSDIDYLKLKKSIQNFNKPLNARINEKYSVEGTKFIKKMNIEAQSPIKEKVISFRLKQEVFNVFINIYTKIR